VGRQRPPDPQPGCERLGERAEVDDLLGLVRAQCARDGAVEAEQTVRIVLEDEQVVPAGLWKLGTV
jgi:hypothetical protein